MHKLFSFSLSALLLTQTVVQADSYLYFKDSKVTTIRTTLDRSITSDEIVQMKHGELYNTFGANSATCGRAFYVGSRFDNLPSGAAYNQYLCESEFSSYTGLLSDIGLTLAVGVMLPVIGLLYRGTAHERNFDSIKLNDYVNRSGYSNYKKYIDNSREIDVIDKLDIDDYVSESNLLLTNAWAWDNPFDILITKSNYANTLYINRSKSMTEAHAQWLNQYAVSTPAPLVVSIPMISKPQLPHYIEPSLIITPKTEFESKAQFEERVNKATKEHDEAVKKAKDAYHQAVNKVKENYADDVNNWNKKVKKEMEKYVEAIEYANKERAKIKSKLSETSDQYKKTLVLFNLGKPQISNPIYDAESQYLKVDFYDAIAKENKALPIKMSPSDAKTLKDNMNAAKIKALYSFENDVITLVKLTVNGSEYTPSAVDRISHKLDFTYDFNKNNEIVVTQDDLNRMFPIQDPQYGETLDETEVKKIIEVAPTPAALPSFHK